MIVHVFCDCQPSLDLFVDVDTRDSEIALTIVVGWRSFSDDQVHAGSLLIEKVVVCLQGPPSYWAGERVIGVMSYRFDKMLRPISSANKSAFIGILGPTKA